MSHDIGTPADVPHSSHFPLPILHSPIYYVDYESCKIMVVEVYRENIRFVIPQREIIVLSNLSEEVQYRLNSNVGYQNLSLMLSKTEYV